LALLAGGLVTLAWRLQPAAARHGEAISPAKPLQDFTLQSEAGPLRLSDLRGRLLLFFFAYTYCPDVCPTALSTLKASVENLGADAAAVQVILVSVDPQRDTPERLGQFVHSFHPAFIGLTGDKDTLDRITADFGVFYRINPPEAGRSDYTVDHSSNILLVDKQGRLAYSWPFDVSAKDLAADLQALMR